MLLQFWNGSILGVMCETGYMGHGYFIRNIQTLHQLGERHIWQFIVTSDMYVTFYCWVVSKLHNFGYSDNPS